MARAALVTGLLLGGAAGGVIGAAPAFAARLAAVTGPCRVEQLYPPGRIGLQVSTNGVVPGQAITVTGEGFGPGTVTDIYLESAPVELASVTSDAQGAFTVGVTIPGDTVPGAHQIVAAGACQSDRAQPLKLSAQITVSLPTTSPPAYAPAPVPPAQPGPLAFTGAEIGLTLAASLALIVLGSVVVLASRRRRVARGSSAAAVRRAPPT